MVLLVSGSGVDDWNNITEILEGKKDWGPYPSFHYWAKPALGYYSSSNKEVIRTHMTQLYTAGVDFIIIDLTNAGDNYLGTSAWTDYIHCEPLIVTRPNAVFIGVSNMSSIKTRETPTAGNINLFLSILPTNTVFSLQQEKICSI